MSCECSSNTPVICQAKPVVKNVNKKLVSKLRIPEYIMNDTNLKLDLEILPKKYNFEIHKTIWRIIDAKATRVALQFPEGLIVFSTTIARIITKYSKTECLIMGDVAYGACCIDDYTAKLLGCDFIVHYAHSCLIPIDRMAAIGVLYVFVEIFIETNQIIDAIKHNFSKATKIALVSTIQFASSLQEIKEQLSNEYELTIPQSKPLSPGEILGCTSPILKNIDVILYVGDGRFHIESIMIHNPSIKAYKYDPYSNLITFEQYDHSRMLDVRKNAVEIASSNIENKTFGIILGSLGRQGSTKVLTNLTEELEKRHIKYETFVISDITPSALNPFEKSIDIWVQTACPRLSIDWGAAFARPILTPYELSVVLNLIEWKTTYPMDHYSNNSLGPWTPNHI